MQRFQGLFGIGLILGLAYLVSNNKKRIDVRLVLSGIGLQVFIALLVFKVPYVADFFIVLGRGMQKIEHFARQGASFVYGGIGVVQDNGNIADFRGGGLVFAFNITAAIILVCALIAVFYYYGIMQRIVAVIAKVMNFIMRVSGAEALSNVASAFVGQIEAQAMIRPYLKTMTMSELLASMSGSLACIAGGILIIYNNMGTHAGMNLAPKLITASLMAAPGALVIAKIVYPETEESQTMGSVKMKIDSGYKNVIDAISHGAEDGFKIAMNVLAMIIGFIAVIAMLDYIMVRVGHIFNPHFDLTLNWLFGQLFYPFAWAMGVPQQDVSSTATLLGQKLTINEFIAFSNLTQKTGHHFTDKGLLVTSIAICGFANFSSVGMQIGGIGELAPERRGDLAKLGLRALFCGTLASYLSATIAGILM